eukprot:g25713.t1
MQSCSCTLPCWIRTWRPLAANMALWLLSSSTPSTWRHEHSVLSIYLGLPVMSLAPFPFHTAKLYSLRRIEQEEYDAFVADISMKIPADELFPVANLPLGPRPGDVVPRPPLSGSQLAKQRWSGGSDPDPVFEAIREHYAVKDLQSRRRSIYYGKCRESLLRRVPQAVPELLPMHDMSSFLKLSMEKLGDWSDTHGHL